MYEAEVNSRVESLEAIPPAVRVRFSEYRSLVEARTLLPWGEHCTECVWPSCYTTCELYDPRIDGGCRQFEGGVVRIPNPEGTAPYLQKITFRRWAKLWTLGTLQCRSLGFSDLAERVNIAIGSAARTIPEAGDLKPRLLRKVAYIRRRRLAEHGQPVATKPHYFVTEVYNPSHRAAALTLSVRGGAASSRRGFQKRIEVEPGFTRDKIPFGEVQHVADDGAFEVELVPNESDSLTLYFGLLDFVRERVSLGPVSSERGELPKCKCVVWDLDNTVWQGVLLEDGPDRLRLRDGVVETIAELDRRGILHSIASKNNPDDAMNVLKSLGIADYFLAPQIHWRPKSESVAEIATALNIGVDTLVFVDDQEFERQEVKFALPQVRTIDAQDVQNIPTQPAFQVPVTEEGQARRRMYQVQEQRAALQSTYHGDYVGFLRDAKMQVRVSRVSETNLERVYELAQRTNQMNFSGNRYSLADVRLIAGDEQLDTYVLRCADRFGSYGIVGFAVVDRREPRLIDLMFSCRVQAKRVEHGFLAWLLRQYAERLGRDFLVSYRRTLRNEPSGAVFSEMGFDELETSEGITTLRFRHGQRLPDEVVIDVAVEEP